MTVMGSNTRELDINSLVLTAYQYAGMMNELQAAEGPHWLARAAYGRKQLEFIIDALDGDGVFERKVEFYSLAIETNNPSYQMPDDTMDIIGNGMLVLDDGNEIPVVPMAREQYFAEFDKSATGMPTRFFLHRVAPMQLYLWPTPDFEGVINFQRQRLSFDNSAGTATVDLERYWMDYLLHELAYRIAIGSGASVERSKMLRDGADRLKISAKGKSGNQLGNQIYVDHRGPYR